MAGSGRRVFQPGEVLTASNVMNYLQDQAVMSFAGTAARGSAIGTAVAQGMVSFRQDTGNVETYFNTYGTANTGGANPAGWYPVNNSSYAVMLRNTVAQSLTTTPTAHTWAVEDYDPNGMHAANSSDVIAPFTGVYSISYMITGATVSNVVDIFAYLNIGTADKVFTRTGASGNNQQPMAHWSGLILANANDVIKVMRGTTYGAGYNSEPTKEYLTVEFIGPKRA